MFALFVRKIGLATVTFLGVTAVTFALIRLVPGDPISAMMGETGVSVADRARAIAQLGLDRPLSEQYVIYLAKILRGDLSRSISSSESVFHEFQALFPATVELGLCALLLATVAGLLFGLLAAVWHGTILDYGTMGFALTGYSMPVFWWALLLIVVFSGALGWTPVSGRIAVQYYIPAGTGFLLVDTLLAGEYPAFRSAARHLILPTIVLSTYPMAVIARMTRSAMLEVLNQEYVRTARANGLPPWRVIGVHALRNALIPVVTVIGLQISALVTGAVMTETIFSWPGVGKWLLDGVYRRDYFVVQGGILLLASIVIGINLLVDVLYGVINPRLGRHG